MFSGARKIFLYDDKVHFNFANRREEIHKVSYNGFALFLNFIFKKVSVLKGKKAKNNIPTFDVFQAPLLVCRSTHESSKYKSFICDTYEEQCLNFIELRFLW